MSEEPEVERVTPTAAPPGRWAASRIAGARAALKALCSDSPAVVHEHASRERGVMIVEPKERV